jgi:hypothetical protein
MRVVIQISQNNTSRVVWKEALISLTTPIFETPFLMELGGGVISFIGSAASFIIVF